MNDPQKVKRILLETPQYLDAIVERIPNAMAASAPPHVDGVHAVTLPVSESLWPGWLTLAVAWLPAYLIKGAGYTTTQAGWVVVLPPLTQIFPFPSIRFWSERLLARGVTSRAARGLVGEACVATAGVAMICLPLAPHPVLQMVFVMLAFVVGSVICTLGPAISPIGQRGAMLGISNAGYALAGFPQREATTTVADALVPFLLNHAVTTA